MTSLISLVAMICRNRTLLKRTLNDRWGPLGFCPTSRRAPRNKHKRLLAVDIAETRPNLAWSHTAGHQGGCVEDLDAHCPLTGIGVLVLKSCGCDTMIRDDDTGHRALCRIVQNCAESCASLILCGTLDY
jgi:hypothetical protein